MVIRKGDFILINYVAKVKEEDKVIDTNIEEEAKKAGIYDENKVYEPKLVIVGEGWVIKGLDEALEKFEVGEEKELEIPPEKAFGVRDPKKVRVIPAKELSHRGIIPRVNMRVEVNGKTAIIRSVGGGRVVLDFNHPLAGKTIVYKVKVIKKIETIEDKIRELVHRWLPGVNREKISIKVQNNDVQVHLPEEILSYERIGIIERGICRDIFKYISNVKRVSFIVTLEKKEKKVESKAEAKTKSKEITQKQTTSSPKQA